MESFIGWIGGKRMLRKAILERFPTDEVGRYIEVFGGAAWVLFAKEKKANQLEVYNDINSQVKGRFILSYNDHPLIRELYADYRIEGITRTTTLAGKGNNQTQYAELIIRNF